MSDARDTPLDGIRTALLFGGVGAILVGWALVAVPVILVDTAVYQLRRWRS